MAIPMDLNPGWYNVTRRLQSVSCKTNNGIAVIRMTVVVDQNGKPLFWTEPSVTKIEPKSSDTLLNLLNNNI